VPLVVAEELPEEVLEVAEVRENSRTTKMTSS